MLKNNFYSIIVHLCFTFIFIMIFDAANVIDGYDSIYYIFPVFNIVTILIYFWMGSKLSDQGSKIKNIISVSAISIIGLIFWFISFYLFESDTGETGLGFYTFFIIICL
jgi:hypothetical protein